MAKKVMKKLKEEEEKTGLQLSVTESGKEGKSNMIASCGFIGNEHSQFSKEGGVTSAESVKTLGVDLRPRVKKLGAKEKREEESARSGSRLSRRIKLSRKNHMKVGVKKLLRAGIVPARTLVSSCSGDSSQGKIEVEECGSSSGQEDHDHLVLVHGGSWP